MSAVRILIAGFGGQGVLFAGKCIAYKGLLEGRQVSWLPSYGPEMRGGTANCSVILSDTPIGSPIVTEPDVLTVMNLPSLEKYENAAEKGAKIFLDCSMIEKKVERTDVSAFYVPATKMANDLGVNTLANMILVGKMIRETGMLRFDDIEDGLKKVISAKHADLLGANLKALEAGYNFKD
ncbi:MAG: 2-oxoacid:acceptor oxidoreductase family protein [Clostridia bacterium]|nr:2-oxoacid:acceptor oxidoreductase family protein [Clostridia bacterium]